MAVMAGRRARRGFRGGTATLVAVAGAVVGVAVGLAGCGGSDPATAPPAGSSSGPVPSSGPVSSSGAVPSSGPVSSSGPAAAGSSAATAYRVTWTPVTEQLTGAKGTVTSPRAGVSGPDEAVRTAAGQVLAAPVTTARQRFAADAAELGGAGQESDQRISVARQAPWDWLYAVQLLEDRYVGGAAHPVDNHLVAVVDWRTGRGVSTSALFAQVRPVDVAVRAALLRASPDLDRATLATITVGPATAGGTQEAVASYPTPAGLWVGVDACVFTCALGQLEVTVPWGQLPATLPGALPQHS